MLSFMNGQKFNTGMLVALGALLLQHFGLSSDQSSSIATNIAMGAGSVLAVVGWIHKWIKSTNLKQTAQSLIPKSPAQAIAEISQGAQMIVKAYAEISGAIAGATKAPATAPIQPNAPTVDLVTTASIAAANDQVQASINPVSPAPEAK